MKFHLEKKFIADQIETTETKIFGYGSLFDCVDQQGDIVAKGAFEKSLEQKTPLDIKMLWQHDPLTPIGVWTQIKEDKKGLYVEGEILSNVQAGREALNLIKSGAVTGLSIGYRTLSSGKNYHNQRILKAVDLWEVSLVTFPMLKGANASIHREEPLSEIQDLNLACQKLRQAIMEADS